MECWKRSRGQRAVGDCARPPRLSEQARDGGQGMRIWDCEEGEKDRLSNHKFELALLID
jgi:hypothetical protein